MSPQEEEGSEGYDEGGLILIGTYGRNGIDRNGESWAIVSREWVMGWSLVMGFFS